MPEEPCDKTVPSTNVLCPLCGKETDRQEVLNTYEVIFTCKPCAMEMTIRTMADPEDVKEFNEQYYGEDEDKKDEEE